MPRPEKVAAVAEVRDDLTDSVATLLTDFRGLSVTEMAELRGELRKTSARYQVVKNTLTRRAADAAGIDGLDDLLVGPTGLVFCEEDPVGPAKALRAFARDHPELVVKGGYLDGQVLDDQAAAGLADLESREELLARVAGLLYGALANFARLLQAPVEQQARLVQALIDAGGVEARGFEPTQPQPAPSSSGAAEVAEDAAAAVGAATDVAAEAADAAVETTDDAAAEGVAAASDAAATAGAAAAEATGSDAVATAAETVVEAVEQVAESAAGAAETAANTAANVIDAGAAAVSRVAEAALGSDEAEPPAAAPEDDSSDPTETTS